MTVPRSGDGCAVRLDALSFVRGCARCFFEAIAEDAAALVAGKTTTKASDQREAATCERCRCCVTDGLSEAAIDDEISTGGTASAGRLRRADECEATSARDMGLDPGVVGEPEEQSKSTARM